MLPGSKSYNVGNPVCFPFECCHVCKENAFVGGAAELSMWVVPMKNLPNILCKCQTASSAVDSCLVSFLGLDDRSLKKQDILVI